MTSYPDRAASTWVGQAGPIPLASAAITPAARPRPVGQSSLWDEAGSPSISAADLRVPPATVDGPDRRPAASRSARATATVGRAAARTDGHPGASDRADGGAGRTSARLAAAVDRAVGRPRRGRRAPDPPVRHGGDRSRSPRRPPATVDPAAAVLRWPQPMAGDLHPDPGRAHHRGHLSGHQCADRRRIRPRPRRPGPRPPAPLPPEPARPVRSGPPAWPMPRQYRRIRPTSTRRPPPAPFRISPTMTPTATRPRSIAAGALPAGADFVASGAGTWHVVPGTTPTVGTGDQRRTYTIEVEDGCRPRSRIRCSRPRSTRRWPIHGRGSVAARSA